ncbi:MAG: TOBE domain-containing protein [Pseudomonadota bacterium]
MISVYHVRVGGAEGRIVKATRTNRVRADEPEITWEDRVVLDWAPSAVVLLQD